MDLKQINSLVMLADTGSFKDAAARLYISASQMTKIIKSIEENLGCEIFKRKRSGVILTETGKKIYGNCVRILKEFSDIEVITNGENRKSLSVISSYNVNISSVFTEFIEKEGETEDFYSLYESSIYPKLSDIKSGKYEIGLTFIEKSQRIPFDIRLKEKGLEFVGLKKCNACIYLRKKHPFSYIKTAGYEDMKKMKFIQLRGGFFIPRFDSGYTSSKKAIFDYTKVGMVTNSLCTVFETVRKTDMVYVGCDLFGNHQKDSELKVISIEKDLGEVEFGYVIHRDSSLSDYSLRFIEYIISKL